MTLIEIEDAREVHGGVNGEFTSSDTAGSVVGPYIDAEDPNKFWYYFAQDAVIDYRCLGKGLDDVAVTVFAKWGFNEIPGPNPNEVVMAWTTTGEFPVCYVDPIMYYWLLDDGFGIIFQDGGPNVKNFPSVKIENISFCYSGSAAIPMIDHVTDADVSCSRVGKRRP